MKLKIDRDKSIEGAEREISRIADGAYDDEGNSLYDGIIVTSRDAATIEGMFSDALSALVKRLSDVISYPDGTDGTDGDTTTCGWVQWETEPGAEEAEPGTEESEPDTEETEPDENIIILPLDLPDFDENHHGMVEAETGRFISMNIVAAWCQERYSKKVEEYAQRGQVAMDKAVALLKTRKKPTIKRK